MATFSQRYYDSILQAMQKKQDTNNNEWNQFQPAWRAADFRYRACSEHSNEFTASIVRAGNAPSCNERYIQDKELYEFFVCGLSCLESLFYGIYAMGSVINHTAFPIATPKDRRKIDPERVVDRYECAFSSEAVSTALGTVFRSDDYKEWRNARNILAHRAVPPRQFYRGGPQDGEAEFRAGFDIPNMSINEHTTTNRFEWLAHTTEELLIAADSFATTHL